jgi:hypothetical protein
MLSVVCVCYMVLANPFYAECYLKVIVVQFHYMEKQNRFIQLLKGDKSCFRNIAYTKVSHGNKTIYLARSEEGIMYCVTDIYSKRNYHHCEINIAVLIRFMY